MDPENSTAIRSATRTKVTATVVCRKMVAIQPICATVMAVDIGEARRTVLRILFGRA